MNYFKLKGAKSISNCDLEGQFTSLNCLNREVILNHIYSKYHGPKYKHKKCLLKIYRKRETQKLFCLSLFRNTVNRTQY